jgi:CubicO group peptidase (beta-lactamase class C family)
MMERRDFLATGMALPSAVHAMLRSPDGSDPPKHGSAIRRTPSADERFEELVSMVEQSMREHGIPGAAFGVIKDGELQMRALGVASVEDPRPVTTDTIFELASLSKTVTATAAVALVQQGRLDLDAPVRRYLPTFRVQDEAASASVTLRNLLTHSGGWEARYAVEEGEGALGRWVSTTGDLVQLAPPGQVWSYNNSCFGLAGRLVEIATGMDFRDALKDLVFAPLELDRASAHIEEIVTWPVALGHRTGRNGAVEVVRPYSMGSSIPAGGVNMSLASLMKYIAFHLGEHDGVGAGAGALSRATREAMVVAQLTKEPTSEQMGLGFHLRTLNGVLTAAHGGTAGAGHRCHLQFAPERRLGFAILTNHTEGWRLLQVVERATLEAYEGLALTPNQPICGYRGHRETLDHVTPLGTQPQPAEYVGLYRGRRGNVTEVRAAPGGGLLVNDAGAPVLFYGPDVAYSSGDEHINHDFIRDNGQVRWMRVSGQIVRKERVSP